MAKVISSKGGTVQVTMVGTVDVMRFLAAKKKLTFTLAEKGLIDAGVFVANEVQESIMGHRAEPKSVRTGLFADNIVAKPFGGLTKGLKDMKIFTEKKTYPGTKTTTQDVAGIMEYSPNIKGGPRRHFRNTEYRTKKAVVEILKGNINKISQVKHLIK